MTKYTAKDFANARFATHPDGRIAARLTKHWAVSTSGIFIDWKIDADLADEDWSPLDETRLPRVVTDEMVVTATETFMDQPARSSLDADMRTALTAALPAAPKTDEDDIPAHITRASEWLIENANTSDAEDCGACMAVADRECAVHHGVLALMADEEAHGIERDENGNLPAPTTDEDAKIEGIRLALRRTQEYVEEVEDGRDDARAFAALWKEAARHHIKHGRMFHASFNEAIKQRDAAWSLAKKAEQDARDARAYAVEQVEAAQAETTEIVKRAEEAEQERSNLERLVGHAEGELADLRAMTAREHLDAAWEAAHVPAGPIPMGTRYMLRLGPGAYQVNRAAGTISDYEDCRLLDPPAPARPEGAEAVEALITEYHEAGTGLALTGKLNGAPLADFLAERGVRVTEDGAS